MVLNGKVGRGRQATVAPSAMIGRYSGIGFAVWAFAIIGTTSLHAQTLNFDCKWHESSPPYSTEFQVDLNAGTASRSDSDTQYKVLSSSDEAVWLIQNANSDRMIAVATISRSEVGGTWTDTQLFADGNTSPISGGSCVERPK